MLVKNSNFTFILGIDSFIVKTKRDDWRSTFLNERGIYFNLAYHLSEAPTLSAPQPLPLF